MKNKRLIILFLLSMIGLFVSAAMIGSVNPVVVFAGYEIFVISGTYITLFVGANSGSREEL